MGAACRVLVTAVAVCLATLIVGCAGGSSGVSGTAGGVDTTGGSVEVSIQIESPAFTQGQPIPRRHTGDGEDVSPALAWSGVPAGARELALIVDDPDASRSQPWVHWVLYKIPAGADGLDEGAGSPDGTGAPAGSLQGTNDFGSYGYGGPAPPRGHGTHHYHFKVYALDVPLDVAPGTDKAALLAAMEGHVLAQGELIGTYER